MDTGIKWLVGLVLASLMLFGVGYSYRWVYDKSIEHQKNADIVAQVQANKEAMVKYDRLVVEYEDLKKSQKVVYRTITKEVEKIIDRPVYSNQCFDNDGVRLYNDALKGTNSSKSAD